MKKILALLLALTMVFALCACGGSSAPAATQAPAAEAPAEAPAADEIVLDVIICQYGPNTNGSVKSYAQNSLQTPAE